MGRRWNIFDAAFVGTSLTAGREKWQQSVETELQKSNTIQLRFHDFGVPGSLSSAGLATIGIPVSFRFDLAVIEYGMNDANTIYGAPLETFKSNVSAMVDAFQTGSPNTKICLMTMNPVVGAALKDRPNVESYYQQIRDIADERKLTLFDVDPQWGNPPVEDIPDGVHPTIPALNRVLVPYLVSHLAPLVS